MFHLNTLAQGGAERVVSNLANELVKGDDEVIITTEWYSEDEFAIDERVKRLHVGFREDDERRGRFRKVFLRLKYLREAIKMENPDVVIAFTRKPIYRTLAAMIGLSTPLIVCVRTDPKDHYEELTDKILLPLFNRSVAGAVFQTTGQRDFFSERWQRISTIILNPVNSKYFADNSDIPKSKTIAQHARIVDFKNHPMLIDAFMMVHKKYPEYDLKIYGPDSFDGTMQIVKKKIKDYEAEDFIHLMGGSDELEKEIPKAEIYAFSSDWEGLPNTLIEAMAMGMPIVATDCPCGGPDTVMEKRTDGFVIDDSSGKLVATMDGILVPIKDPEALACGIIYMIEHPQFAAECASHARRISAVTNSANIVKQWKEYIDEVISGKTQR